MTITMNDIEIIRYIQADQNVNLDELSRHFNKNSTTIRRTIDSVNNYSASPIISITNSVCSTKMTYEDLVSFIQSIRIQDYKSNQTERINVFIVSVFFDSYVNASKLYEGWGLSLTTKKKDMAYLREYLNSYDLEVKQVHKKGLTIVGNELMLRLLVCNILYPLYDIKPTKSFSERVTNNPIEHQCYSFIPRIAQYELHASSLVHRFLDTHQLKITAQSEKFIMLFTSFMMWKPMDSTIDYSKDLPLQPTSLHFSNDESENIIYNVVLVLLDYSRHLDFPFNAELYEITCTFVEQLISCSTSIIYTRMELINDFYAYFYRIIQMKYLQVELPDKLVDHFDDALSIQFQLIQKYAEEIEKRYKIKFNEEQYATLTFILQKMIMRNRIVTNNDETKIKVIVVSNSTYERIDYFKAQIQEYFDIEFVSVLNLKERSTIQSYEYDYILCLSERIYNILKNEGYPVIQCEYFVTNKTHEKLSLFGFQRIKTRFLTEQIVDEIHELSKEEMIAHLKEKYTDYFI